MQRGRVQLDLAHEGGEVPVQRRVDHLLHHVVAVLVPDHGPEVRVLRAHLRYQPAALLARGAAHALLHHVAGELVL